MQERQELRATPAALGYRPVGEWERNAACWSAWPAREYAWGAFLSDTQREFVAFCHTLLERDGAERLELLVPDEAAERDAREALSKVIERVRFRRVAYGDVWLRDTAPLFVRRGHSELASVYFRFNGWGDKYDYPGDTDLGARVADVRGVPVFAIDDVILEGGALEWDGAGTCLTTESCLLNENRRLDGKPHTRARLEAVLRDALAIEKVLWLREGLAGDHTDGHIDNIARFAAPGVVLHMRASGANDPNAATYEAIERDLASFVDARGKRLRLLPIPSPGRVLDVDGRPMPASYMNFYVGNRVVIVPAFDSAYDEPARLAIASAFPGREVRSCLARATLEGGGGTFHCMTRQEPELSR